MAALYTVHVSLSEFFTVAATGLAGIYAIDKISSIETEEVPTPENTVRITTHIQDGYVAEQMNEYLEQDSLSSNDISRMATLVREGDVTGTDQIRDYLLSMKTDTPLTVTKKSHFYWIENSIGISKRNGIVTLAIEVSSKQS